MQRVGRTGIKLSIIINKIYFTIYQAAFHTAILPIARGLAEAQTEALRALGAVEAW